MNEFDDAKNRARELLAESGHLTGPARDEYLTTVLACEFLAIRRSERDQITFERQEVAQITTETPA